MKLIIRNTINNKKPFSVFLLLMIIFIGGSSLTNIDVALESSNKKQILFYYKNVGLAIRLGDILIHYDFDENLGWSINPQTFKDFRLEKDVEKVMLAKSGFATLTEQRIKFYDFRKTPIEYIKNMDFVLPEKVDEITSSFGFIWTRNDESIKFYFVDDYSSEHDFHFTHNHEKDLILPYNFDRSWLSEIKIDIRRNESLVSSYICGLNRNVLKFYNLKKNLINNEIKTQLIYTSYLDFILPENIDEVWVGSMIVIRKGNNIKFYKPFATKSFYYESDDDEYKLEWKYMSEMDLNIDL
jgi:hypothetical protein